MSTLVRIAAPPGTGKTTVLPHLIALARTRAVVADIDEILEDSSLLGVLIAHPDAAPLWPAYDRLWDRIADLSLRAGFPMLLLTQVPEAGDPGGRGMLLGWDVDDELRSRRLRARGEAEAVVNDAQEDAISLRSMVDAAHLIRTGADDTAEACAAAIWGAASRRLGDSGNRDAQAASEL